MKNLLLILPLSIAMSVAMAQSDQNTKMNNSTSSLDGKAFKITLSQRMDHSGATGSNTEGTTTGSGTVADPGSGTTTNTTKNSSGTSGTTTTTQTKSGSGMDNMANKKMIIHFNNGTIRANALTMQGISSCPYNVTSNSGTMTTFNANCSGSTTGKSSGTMNNKYNSGTGASTNPDQNNSSMNSGTGNTSTSPGTGNTSTGSGTGTSTSSGTGNTSMSSGTGNTTPADKTATDAGDQNSVSGTQSGTSATTGNGVSSGMVKAMWSGTVDGTTIRGNLTCTTENGQTYYYTFTGTKASQKELDNEQELGSR